MIVEAPTYHTSDSNFFYRYCPFSIFCFPTSLGVWYLSYPGAGNLAHRAPRDDGPVNVLFVPLAFDTHLDTCIYEPDWDFADGMSAGESRCGG